MDLGGDFPSDGSWVTVDRAATFFKTDRADVVERIERGELNSRVVSGQRQVQIGMPGVSEFDATKDSAEMWQKCNDTCHISSIDGHIKTRFLTDLLRDQTSLHDGFDEIEKKIDFFDDASVTFDLEGVHNISSSAVARFFKIAKVMRNRPGRMRVINCLPWIERSLKVVRLDKLCDIEAGLPDSDSQS